MVYSSVGFLAIILNFIINRDAFRIKTKGDERDAASLRVDKRYRFFLIAATCYYFTDAAWGILYNLNDARGVFPFLYSATVFYFIFMLLTMLTWVHYVVAYLDKRGAKSKVLYYSVWAMFFIGIAALMANRFFHFIFSFNENHEYIEEQGRFVIFGFQILLYMVTTIYTMYIAGKNTGKERERYLAVGLTGLVLEAFQLLQIQEPFFPFYAMGLLIGTCVIHSFVEVGEKKKKETYDNIARSMAEGYEAIYYIDIESGEYREFSKSEAYDSMNVPMKGKDFYAETRENALRFAHPDDKEFAEKLYYKETILKNLEGRNSFFYKYRIMVGEEAKHFRFTVMRVFDGKHIVLSVKDISDEVTAETMHLENQKRSITFSRIAESLASNYDVIYYVDVQDSSYVAYHTNNIYGQLEIRQEGGNFFTESEKNIPKIIHRSDRDKVLEYINREHLIKALESHKECHLDYRLMVNGKAKYTRMTARKTSDGSHFLIGVEDIDADVKKEKQVLKQLNTEKALARRDELTGVKNKTAYTELEKSVQSNIDNGMDYLPFAIVVCDANDLKKVNDTEGHAAGDEYIRSSARLLSDTFVNSPVFRVGGDEFVVFVRGDDYINRSRLMEKLRNIAVENQKKKARPVLASGIAEYIPSSDSLVSDIFDRADKEMYENKQSLKNIS